MQKKNHWFPKIETSGYENEEPNEKEKETENEKEKEKGKENVYIWGQGPHAPLSRGIAAHIYKSPRFLLSS